MYGCGHQFVHFSGRRTDDRFSRLLSGQSNRGKFCLLCPSAMIRPWWFFFCKSVDGVHNLSEVATRKSGRESAEVQLRMPPCGTDSRRGPEARKSAHRYGLRHYWAHVHARNPPTYNCNRCAWYYAAHVRGKKKGREENASDRGELGPNEEDNQLGQGLNLMVACFAW